METFLFILAIGVIVCLFGCFCLYRGDDTPEVLFGVVVALVGLVLFAIGLVGFLSSWSNYGSQIRQQKLESKVQAKLIDEGRKQIEFHDLAGTKVVSYVDEKGRSCGAIVRDLQKFVCFDVYSGPVYGSEIKTELRNLIRK